MKERGDVQVSSPAKLMGHPIHPMLIPFPIALWVFSLAADLIYLWRDNPAWAWIAFYTLAGGTLSAIVAAVFGIIDYFSIRDKKVSKIAAWHARFNVLALLVFAASFYLRTTGGAGLVGGSLTIPLALSIVGVLSITISGWLGGELVYKHGVAVDKSN
ncbi:MAG TPA: DUF2231 domain-containing protein [Pyrinomonadaceae bacterium]|nr:DUF2231 domain-containing protein [Pyrinomonadaceae bacterium]